MTDSQFRLLRDLIYEHAGIALNDSKRHMVQARLQKRLRHYNISSFSDYYDIVIKDRASGNEMRELINCITTNKTDFFREPHHFDYVANTWVPQLLQEAASGQRSRRLRIWHAGCSTGEEPYTLAMVLSETLLSMPGWDVKLLATDIDTQVLDFARTGIYEEDKVSAIPADIRPKYLLRRQQENASIYKVRPQLQSMIKFLQLNLLSNPWPFKSDTLFDAIFCRNVIIYFDKPCQQVLFERFTKLLVPNGLLFLGHSETLFGLTTKFVPAGTTLYCLRDPCRQAVV